MAKFVTLVIILLIVFLIGYGIFRLLNLAFKYIEEKARLDIEEMVREHDNRQRDSKDGEG